MSYLLVVATVVTESRKRHLSVVAGTNCLAEKFETGRYLHVVSGTCATTFFLDLFFSPFI